MSETLFSPFGSKNHQLLLELELTAVELDDDQLQQNRQKLIAKYQIGRLLSQLQIERDCLKGGLDLVHSLTDGNSVQTSKSDALFAHYIPMVSRIRDLIRDTSESVGGFVVQHDVELETGAVEPTLSAVSYCEYEVREADASTLVGWDVGTNNKFDFTLDQIIIE